MLSPQPDSCWGAGFTHGTGAGPKRLAGSSPPHPVRKTFGEPERAVVLRSLSLVTTQPRDPPQPQTNKPLASSIRGQLCSSSLFKNLGSWEKQLTTPWGPNLSSSVVLASSFTRWLRQGLRWLPLSCHNKSPRK